MPPLFCFVCFVFQIDHVLFGPQMQNWKSYEWLNNQYNDRQLSWPQIAKIVGVSTTMVRLVAKQLGIKSRSLRQARLLHNDLPLLELKNAYEAGRSIAQLAKQYGVAISVMRTNLLAGGTVFRDRETSRNITFDNDPSKFPRSIWANSAWLLDNYRDKSVAELSEMVGWSKTYIIELAAMLGVKLRSSSDSIKLKWCDDEYRRKHAEYLANNPRVSQPQLRLYELLANEDIEFEPESKATQIGYYSFDALIPSARLLIEVQGSYFHSGVKAIDRDRRKFDYITNYHKQYRVMYVWEDDIKNSPETVIKNIKLKLQAATVIDFDFSDVSVSLIGFDEAKKFLDAYHYIGGKRAGLAVGARLDSQLVAAAVFAPPIRQNLNAKYKAKTIELARMCIASDRHKFNFASWFLSRAVKLVPPSLIVAYADKTVGHDGAIYKAANFTLHHEVASDYWYTNQDGYVLHKKTLYNRARKQGLSEKAYAIEYGYVKVYGLPKLAFVLDRRLPS